MAAHALAPHAQPTRQLVRSLDRREEQVARWLGRIHHVGARRGTDTEEREARYVLALSGDPCAEEAYRTLRALDGWECRPSINGLTLTATRRPEEGGSQARPRSARQNDLLPSFARRTQAASTCFLRSRDSLSVRSSACCLEVTSWGA